MNRVGKIVAAGTLGALLVATAPALAGQQTRNEGRTDMGAGVRQDAKLTVSAPHLLHHAYKEALHVHEAIALGMNDMARNHAENVEITLGAIDLKGDLAVPSVRDGVARLRDEARAVARTPDMKRSEELVGHFVAFFAAMPQTRTGGGGGLPARAKAAMMASPVDHLAMASSSFADAQTDTAVQNFEAARLHVRHGIMSLDHAAMAARTAGRDDLIAEVKQLRASADRATRLVESRDASAVQETGALVTRLGHGLTRMSTGKR